MLTFAAVNWKNYQGRGVEYCNKLYDMVTRNLKEGTKGRFVVFTDDIGESGHQAYHPAIELYHWEDIRLDGWYNKIRLLDQKQVDFKWGDRIVFFDLDTAITGSLDEIAAYDGPFAILRDFYRPNGLGSACMLWEHGRYQHIWDSFKEAGFPWLTHGDQEWIERTVQYPVILQQQFPNKFHSYKLDCRFGIPQGCSVVIFHGNPRPHDCKGWVEYVWKVGGATSAQLELVANVDSDTVRSNIERSENDPSQSWLAPIKPHGHVALICAGGPSLKDEINSIQAHVKDGAHVFGCNNVPNTLNAFGIDTNFHVVLDARPENAVFTRGIGENTVCLYASQCDRTVHDAAGGRLVLWHPAFEGVLDIVGADKERTYIGGGTTCGMKAATLAWTLGYREIHLYGFDSCYRGDEHHAYPQSLNDNELVLDVEFNEKHYKCSPWMIQQAEDFETFGPQLLDHGTKLFVHGSGLIPDIANQFKAGIFRPEAADFRAMAILERLQGIESPKVAEIGVFAGDLSRRLLARKEDLELVMVDSWEVLDSEEFKASGDWHQTLTAEAQEGYFALTKRVTSFAGDRAKIIRARSVEAAKQIPDESLDMVFIDADHTYSGCKADIHAYYDKVKPGGFVAGHDYAAEGYKFGEMVKRAVDEFVTENGLVLDLGENTTWFARKPIEGNPNVF